MCSRAICYTPNTVILIEIMCCISYPMHSLVYKHEMCTHITGIRSRWGLGALALICLWKRLHIPVTNSCLLCSNNMGPFKALSQDAPELISEHTNNKLLGEHAPRHP